VNIEVLKMKNFRFPKKIFSTFSSELTVLKLCVVLILCTAFMQIWSGKQVIGDIHSLRIDTAKLYWLGPDPETDTSDFLYYQAIGQALRSHPSLEICKSDVISCLDSGSGANATTTSSIVLAIPHDMSKTLDTLEKAAQAAMNSLELLKYEHVQEPTRRSRVLVAMFCNKVYADLDQKVEIFRSILNVNVKFVPGNLSIKLVIFTWSPKADNWSELYGIPFVFVPFAAESKLFDVRAQREDSNCDVFLHWDTNPDKYDFRAEISKNFTSSEFFNRTGLKVVAPKDFVPQRNYLKYLANCKFQISTIGMPGTINLVGTRFFEVLASGTALLFSDRPTRETASAYEMLNIDENITVFFSSTDELIQRMLYFKQYPGEADKLKSNALLWSNLNQWKNRADDIFKHLKNHI